VEGWQLGLIAVLVIGVAAIVFGAVRDRRINERRRREMLAPPERSIPKFAPDAPTPSYLSELQARRPPADARPTGLSPAERDELRAAMAAPDTTVIDRGYASDDLVTDQEAGWSVLHRPNVLVAEDGIATVRELLGVLENQLPTGRPLVVVAPAISDELLATFAVNHIRQVITVLPVIVADDDVRRRIAGATGARPMSHLDLQSGYLAPGMLGGCETWVSTSQQSHILR
jgi:hypothetical protein